jgi:hypothetical protein
MLLNLRSKADSNSSLSARCFNSRADFKSVTYELLCNPEFMRIAGEAIPILDTLHDEFDAAKAERQT